MSEKMNDELRSSEDQTNEEETEHAPTDEELAAQFPGFSEYEERTHCFCKMTYYPKIKKYFWGEWEFQPFMPGFVLFLIISSYIVGIIFCFPYFRFESIILIPVITFLFLMFLISYIQIIRIGPGYFPFYWGAKQYLKAQNPGDVTGTLLTQDQVIPGDDHSDLLLGDNGIICPKDGLMTSSEQYTWAHQLKRPERAVLARSARRIVLRPDHLCDWTTVWIGKRNHKLFMLFNFYGFIYLTIYCIYMSRRVLKIFWDFSHIGTILVITIYCVLSFAFAILTISFVCSTVYDLRHNQTSWESWNNIQIPAYDRGSLMNNLEDVCGPSTHIIDWFKPISPFSSLSNEELANQYSLQKQKYEQTHESQV